MSTHVYSITEAYRGKQLNKIPTNISGYTVLLSMKYYNELNYGSSKDSSRYCTKILAPYWVVQYVPFQYIWGEEAPQVLEQCDSGSKGKIATH